MRGRIKRADAAPRKVQVAGKLKVGFKNERGFPQSLDHFVATGQYASFFDEAFGEKPNKVPIVFFSDDPAVSCNERWEGRDSAGKLYGRGDGETWEIYDPTKDAYLPVDPEADRNRVRLDLDGKPVKWSVRLTLRFLIPAIPIAAAWEIETGGSKSSIQALRDSFDQVLESAGTVCRIPFDLMVKKVTSQKPKSRSTYPVLQLICNLSDQSLLGVRQLSERMDLNRIPIITPQLLEEKAAQNNSKP